MKIFLMAILLIFLGLLAIPLTIVSIMMLVGFTKMLLTAAISLATVSMVFIPIAVTALLWSWIIKTIRAF